MPNSIDRPIPESYWVEPGRFLAGEFPGSFSVEIARTRLDAFLKAGLQKFIDLTQPHELMPYQAILKEQAALRKVDAEYDRFPIRDHGVPSVETMLHVLDAIEQALDSGRNVYVHCWGGVGRTGLAVACYLVRHGRTNEQALAQVNRLFKTRPTNPRFPTSPETEEQVEFVLNWREPPRTGPASHDPA
jgi:hypothetical protein